MGVMADSMAAYAQPLFDETDGSLDQMRNAMSIAQLCWNLALLADTEREERIAEMCRPLKMNDTEFADFRETVIGPMISRHHEMFPDMRQKGLQHNTPTTPQKEKKYPGTGRNEQCPCNSGNKYKRCCGK